MVFANPDVVETIKSKFIPVALKAGLVSNPPSGIEGDLYREIKRTQVVPQGICVVNSAGKTLDWVLSFQDNPAVAKYFNEVVKRYETHPKSAVATRRFQTYPNQRLVDVADNGIRLQIPPDHEDERCPADADFPKGSLVGKIVGRPLGNDGNPIDKTLRQEDYMEATLEVTPLALNELLKANDRSSGAFEVPESLIRDLVGPAYLGQLDVSPLLRNPKSEQQARWWSFRAKPMESKEGRWIHLTGKSHVAADGPRWEHAVTLSWQGYVRIVQGRAIEIQMMARGRERLTWEQGNMMIRTQPDSAHLMAGHPIKLECDVIYGLNASVPNTSTSAKTLKVSSP